MWIYEELFIVRPDATEEEVDALVEAASQTVTNGGGTVDKVEKWGVRKLAYRVAKREEGYYVLMQITSNPEPVKEVERRFRVSDDVLKFLTVRIDKKLKMIEKKRQEREKRAKRKPPGDLRAYDLMLQALPGLVTSDRVKRAASETLLRRALALEPDYALALARLANCIWGSITSGRLSDTVPARAEIAALVGQALATGMNDPEVLAYAGYALGMCHDLHAGIECRVPQDEQASTKNTKGISHETDALCGVDGRGSGCTQFTLLLGGREGRR